MLKNIAIVFVGGGLGSVLRYLISKFMVSTHYFFIGTWFVNLLGSFILGFLAIFFIKNSSQSWVPEMGLFLAIGFCGGFTTFSTFSYENILLLQQKKYLLFGGYTFSSLFISFFFAWLGIILAEKII